MSSIPQIGQAPGVVEVKDGCMGQTQATSSSGGSSSGPRWRAPAQPVNQAPPVSAVAVKLRSNSRLLMGAGGVAFIDALVRDLVGVGPGVSGHVQSGAIVGPVHQAILEYRIGSGDTLGHGQ